MKRNITSHFLKINLFVLITFFFASCGGEENTTTQEQKTVAAPVKTTPPKVEKYAKPAIKQYHVSTLEHQELAYLSIDKAFTFVAAGNEQLNGELKGVKRKYTNATGRLTYVVKHSDDGFKLRDSLETLRWKVKVYPEKIKIADNEEMNNSFEIKRTDNFKIKIEQHGSELFKWKVAQANESGKTNLMDQFMITGFDNKLSSGVLLLKNIPQIEQYVIAVELLDKGQ